MPIIKTDLFEFPKVLLSAWPGHWAIYVNAGDSQLGNPQGKIWLAEYYGDIHVTDTFIFLILLSKWMEILQQILIWIFCNSSGNPISPISSRDPKPY